MSVAELSQPMVSAPADEEEATAEKTMTIMEHLQELRMRLAVGAGAIVVGMIPGWFLFDSVFGIMREPIQKLGPLHYFGPVDAFTLQLKISAVTGTMLAMPVLLYQAWAFIAPGLTKKERKHSIPFVALGAVLFACGVYTAYRILPLSMAFLLGFTSDNLQPVLDAQKYLSFIGLIMLIFGISFE